MADNLERMTNDEKTRALEEEQLLSLFVEQNPCPVVRFDGEGRIRMMNPAARVVLGENAVGSRLTEFYQDLEDFNPAKCITSGVTEQRSSHVGGRSYHLHIRGLPRFGVGHIYANDVTELKQMQAERETSMRKNAEMDRMASLGRLGGGVAHEINNALAGIIGMAEIVKMSLSRGDGEVALILKEAHRAARITKDLLLFARPKIGRIEKVRVQEILMRVLKIVGNDLAIQKISTNLHAPENLPEIFVDAGQIHQVFLNLILNAKDAMPHGGRIDLRAETEGDWIRIDVVDTGTGVPDCIHSRIFEPFFTTKGVGKGTGLGLSVVSGIVKSHGGTIEVSNPPDGGAEFSIRLPLVSPSSGAAAEDPDEQKPRKTDSKAPLSILLVDDEPSIRTACSRLLTLSGHQVRVAANVEEALVRLEEEVFDVVISDQSMPGADGLDLHRILATRNRSEAKRFVLMTGLAPEEIRSEAEVMVVSKPLDLKRLRDVISRVVSRHEKSVSPVM